MEEKNKNIAPFHHYLLNNTKLLTELFLPANQEDWCVPPAKSKEDAVRICYRIRKIEVNGDDIDYLISCTGDLFPDHQVMNFGNSIEFNISIFDGLNEGNIEETSSVEEMGFTFMQQIQEHPQKREDWNRRQSLIWQLGMDWLRGAGRFTLGDFGYSHHLDPKADYLTSALAVQIQRLRISSFVSHLLWVPRETHDWLASEIKANKERIIKNKTDTAITENEDSL